MKTLITILLLISPTLVIAQTDNIPRQITDIGVSDAKEKIDLERDKIKHFSELISNYQTLIASWQSQINDFQNDIDSRRQALTALATQSVPVPSAVSLCASDNSYCIE